MTLTLSQLDPAQLDPGQPDPGQPDPDPDFGAIRLVGHGTTVTAENLRTQLVVAFDLCDSTVIDTSESLSVGQAVLQLLIAARNEAKQHGHDFRFVATGAIFSERVNSYQLAEAIGLEIVKDISQ